MAIRQVGDCAGCDGTGYVCRRTPPTEYVEVNKRCAECHGLGVERDRFNAEAFEKLSKKVNMLAADLKRLRTGYEIHVKTNHTNFKYIIVDLNNERHDDG